MYGSRVMRGIVTFSISFSQGSFQDLNSKHRKITVLRFLYPHRHSKSALLREFKYTYY